MIWMCFFLVTGDLQESADQAFVNHIVANHWEQVAELELKAKESKNSKAKGQMQQTIREAKGAKTVIFPRKDAFTDSVSWERRRTGTRQVLVPNPSAGRSEVIDEGLYSYAFSVDWAKAADGDCLHIDMTYDIGQDMGKAIAQHNIDIFDEQAGVLLAHPVNWRLGSDSGEILPTTMKDFALRLIDSGQLQQREGITIIDGFGHVAAVRGKELTLVRVDSDAIEKQAQAKIRTGKPKAAQNL